jgi:hypothetical protein
MLTTFALIRECDNMEETISCENSSPDADPDADPVPDPAPICGNHNETRSTPGYVVCMGRSGWP